MRLSFRAAWSLVASLAYLGANHAMVDAAGVMEVDLLFPRSSQTYEPTPYMPVVFAIQKAELARHIYPSIQIRVRNLSNPDEGQGKTYNQHLDLPNGTVTDSEPFFMHTLIDAFATEGIWALNWDFNWISCQPTSKGDFLGHVQWNSSEPFHMTVNTTKGGQSVDLVAATGDEKACRAGRELAFALNVTDEILSVNHMGGEQESKTPTCVMVPDLQSEPTLNFCGPKIDATLAANISDEVKTKLCHGPNPPADCPPKSNPSSDAVPRLAVAGTASMVAAFGALGFFLA